MSFNNYKILALILGFTIPSVSHSQPANNPCVQVYANAVHNVEIQTQERSSRSFYYNLYCEQSGEAKSFEHNGAVGIPIEGIPIEVNGDWSWDEAELKNFCKIGAKESYANGSDFGYGRYVVTDALNSFNQCIALQSKNVTITHQEAPPNSFIVTIDLEKNVAVTLDNVEYQESEMTCRSTNFNKDKDNLQAQLVNGDQGYPINSTVNIGCTRKGLKLSDGGTYYPRATFQVSTSQGPYTAILPANRHFGFDLASQAEAAHAEAIARYNTAQTEKTALEIKLTCAKNSLDRVEKTLPTAWKEWKRIAGTYANHPVRNNYINEFMNSTDPSPLDLEVTKHRIDRLIKVGKDC